MPIRLALAALLSAAPAQAEAPRGSVTLRLTYNPTPDADWHPETNVLLYADARRNAALGQEDLFASTQFGGSYPRTAGHQFDFTLVNVRPGELVWVQGYLCSADGETDCCPSDKDNPPACAVQVRVLGGFRPSCSPSFTWTGGGSSGPLLCRAECR